MTLLILGVLLWTFAHYFKRLAPAARAGMGDKGKGPVAIALFAALVLMVIGYRNAPYIELWLLPEWARHINNLLMVVSVLLFGMSSTKGALRGRMRHPMLTGVIVWAVAHLLVNGDVASVILFGGMFAWAIGAVVLINRAEIWARPEPGQGGWPKFLIISAVVYAVIAAIHAWLGVWPFAGAMP